MSDITYEHIKAIAKLENDVKERDATIKQLKSDVDHNVKRALEIAEEKDATIKQLQEEKAKLKEALREAADYISSHPAERIITVGERIVKNASKLIEP